ncbi:MAG TPA: DUF3710 domain-containing protein [Cryptosporangiaceae bacterium]|nr:DUF3710 domain-containing protein [Cryptosporangiaceae bacterium]
MFRRRGARRDGAENEVDEVDTDDVDESGGDAGGADPDDGDGPEAGPRRAYGSGPWDAEDPPDDDLARVDLGALRVPTLPDVEVRVEADPQGQVTAVLLVHDRSAVQLGAFAAPRSEGIWEEVREEIGSDIRAQGGVAEDRKGEFGTELWARIQAPEGGQSLRFVGVDGPRWFLRAVYTGAAATNPDTAPVLSESVRQVVVNRGGEALPVRDPLPLQLPRDIVEQQAEQAEEAAQAAAQAPPARPKRGPEITEIG